MQIVETARLRIRTATLADHAFFYALVNDPAFIEHIGDKGVRTLEDACEALRTGPIAMQEARGHSLYVVELREDAIPIGMCGLIKRDTLPGVDLGYAYLPAWRGQGYAWEAAQAMLAYAPTLGIHSLLAIVSPDNHASNGLLRKLGMGFVKCDAGTNLYSIDL